MAAFEISDTIHKTIALSAREKTIIDHPYLQRLRFIRQLGFVPLVYPSATHDRFSHALGTLHVVSLLSDQFFSNDSHSLLASLLSEKEKQFLRGILRLAALLHDVGHAPFSHTAEKIMPSFRELDLPKHWLRTPDEHRSAKHEDYSVLLTAGMAEEAPHALLAREEAEIIASLVHHKKIKIPPSWKKHFSPKINAASLHAFARSLISSDIDADRMDYLLRDAHFAGVTYGHFDLPWLISNLGVVKNNDDYVLSISDSGVHALEHYLLARSNMYAQVYMHKTVKCFEYYFQKALDERETDYAIPAGRDQYVSLRDSTLIENLFHAAEKNPRSWSARLIRREAAKRIARIWNDREIVEKIFRGIERDLAPYAIHPFFHFSKSRFLDINPLETSRKNEPAHDSLFSGLATLPVMVIRKHFGVVSAASLADYSFILKRYHQDIAMGDIYVLRDEYEEHQKAIHTVVKKYHTASPSEIILREEL